MKPLLPFALLLVLTSALAQLPPSQPTVPVHAQPTSPAPAAAHDEQALQAQLNRYLWDAARSGNNAMMAEFIRAGYNLNTADEKGYSAVILAAYHGHDDTLALLLAHGADPCQQDKRGNTALMGAIFKGELKIAQRLMAATCNPNLRNHVGQTAAMYASLFQRSEILTALQAKGADLSATDAFGNSVHTLGQGEVRGH
ncbi:ankyrin repeat domain-containing protein [Dickeya lacustris]|uniref:Ankyrin repeat domain-containing protein n=1 Tax=Dickeya lacustris TaxID=2259638 RepID=A0ABY8GAM8_9GAMM|nr:ankyrin repeat domain-containing protein [Dickeya lacustris]WFN57012.1 ankyrin repeat domain-containing protein [Dickeya lacustris]